MSGLGGRFAKELVAEPKLLQDGSGLKRSRVHVDYLRTTKPPLHALARMVGDLVVVNESLSVVECLDVLDSGEHRMLGF